MIGSDPRIGVQVFVVGREKLVGYLLDLQHPTGASKAAFFLGRGFSRERPDDLAHALRKHGRNGELIGLRMRSDGQYIAIAGGVLTPLNRVIHIRTVWALRPIAPGVATFVTAYPGER
ncbi:DUF6883 domain-containing protein [Enterovirga sp. CN4-39]|uniref:DUF6883 domain-containing protein n=1 Tax=Enterovirga sp. CN4-39 TaxID=3400910 RepID=UPI003C022247